MTQEQLNKPQPIVLHEMWSAMGVTKIAITEYHGRRYLDMRFWAKLESPEKGEVIVPTKKGVSIPLYKLEEFLKAVNKAKAFVPKEERKENTTHDSKPKTVPAVPSVRSQAGSPRKATTQET